MILKSVLELKWPHGSSSNILNYFPRPLFRRSGFVRDGEYSYIRRVAIEETTSALFTKNRIFDQSVQVYLFKQLSKFTSAVGNCRGFCRGKQSFYSNHLGKNTAEVIIS